MSLFFLHIDLRSLTPWLCFYPQLLGFDYFTQICVFISDTARQITDILYSVSLDPVRSKSKASQPNL